MQTRKTCKKHEMEPPYPSGRRRKRGVTCEKITSGIIINGRPIMINRIVISHQPISRSMLNSRFVSFSHTPHSQKTIIGHQVFIGFDFFYFHSHFNVCFIYLLFFIIYCFIVIKSFCTRKLFIHVSFRHLGRYRCSDLSEIPMSMIVILYVIVSVGFIPIRK